MFTIPGREGAPRFSPHREEETGNFSKRESMPTKTLSGCLDVIGVSKDATPAELHIAYQEKKRPLEERIAQRRKEIGNKSFRERSKDEELKTLLRELTIIDVAYKMSMFERDKYGPRDNNDTEKGERDRLWQSQVEEWKRGLPEGEKE